MYFDEQGILRKEAPAALSQIQRLAATKTTEAFLQKLESLDYYPGRDYWHFHALLERFIGKSEDEVYEHFKKRADFNRNNREERKAKKERDPFRGMFDDRIIGLSSDFCTYPDGFNVRVLFKVGDYTPRKEFVREHQKEFLIAVMRAIAMSKSKTRSIGDIRFYKPTEITVLTNVPEVEIQFETKIALNETQALPERSKK